jgi:hypothetical protein
MLDIVDRLRYFKLYDVSEAELESVIRYNKKFWEELIFYVRFTIC